jgi:hypothetical protein
MATLNESLESTSLSQIVDRLAIIETASMMHQMVDARSWDSVARMFADPIVIDFASVWSGGPLTFSPDELVRMWRLNEEFAATHHHLAGHTVNLDGDRATCVANGVNWHLLPNSSGGPTWMVAGRYDFGLQRSARGWLISSVKFAQHLTEGNNLINLVAMVRANRSAVSQDRPAADLNALTQGFLQAF